MAKYVVPIKISKEANMALTKEAKKRKETKQDILEDLIINHFDYKPLEQVPKVLTKDLKIEGKIDITFIFNEENCTQLGKIFLGVTEAIVEGECDVYLLMNNIEGLEIKFDTGDIERRFNTDRKYPPYEITEQVMTDLKGRINAKSWQKIWDIHETGNKKFTGTYYQLKNSMFMLEDLISEEEMENINSNLNHRGEILEEKLLEILSKYKEQDASYTLNDVKYERTVLDCILSNINQYRIEYKHIKYWGWRYFEREFPGYLTECGLNDKEIELLKKKAKLPFENQDHTYILQYIKELVYLYNCTVKVNVRPIKQLWREVKYEGNVFQEGAGIERDLNFSWDTLRNAIIFSNK